jgi:hypothetical protein
MTKTLPGWHELPKLPPGGKASGCRACGLVFTTTRSFDDHRVRGCCLTATELEARGWSTNPKGWWRPKPRPMGAKFAAERARAQAVREARLKQAQQQPETDTTARVCQRGPTS